MKSQRHGTSNGAVHATKRNGSSAQQSLLEKFFVDQLQDIYYAEQLLLKALPEMQKAATTEELEDAIADHLKQTERHVRRLEKVFQIIDIDTVQIFDITYREPAIRMAIRIHILCNVFLR